MPDEKNSGRDTENIAAELKRLREASAAGAETFKAIEARIAQLEEQITKARQDSGITKPAQK